ncbi:BMP family lipoprotein [Demequina lutea]|uniref:Basic membrane protein A n=1 Tax=Demequina lutea TaxID=431489 RepID=A0A7Y9ZBC7_9MICO|nr:BMP family ABC transporter substrate-binding protein [Demequina lutea]NYI42244.1 basic membrane protein A [Demequina lutea]
MKNTLRIGAIAAASALALAACSSAPATVSTGTSAAPTTSAAANIDYKACMVSDAGGFDDGSFNQSGFEGLQRAKADLHINTATAESNSADQYAPNIAAMVAANCNLIITVGFALSQATVDAALANPTISFAIVDDLADNNFDGTTDAPNIKPLTFQTDQAAYLAGYASASATKTGTIATFGGIAYPSVTIFMDGFLAGADAYNKDAGKSVSVLGWDGANGQFTGDFDDLSKGQTAAQAFIDQGADIILPVAGPVGGGAAAAAQAAGNTWIVGVDADWTVTYPAYKDIILTSILKNIGNSVYDTIKEAVSPAGMTYTPYVGTLANGGVGIAPFADGTVSADVQAKLADLTKGIIAGTIKTTPGA